MTVKQKNEIVLCLNVVEKVCRCGVSICFLRMIFDMFIHLKL